MVQPSMKRIDEVFADVFKYWFKAKPQIIRHIKAENTLLEGLLFKKREEQKAFIKEYRSMKVLKLKNMSLEDKMNQLKAKNLI